MKTLVPKERRQPGVVLPIVLIALLVVTVFAAAMARAVIAQSQHARRLDRQQQAAWLADSGVQRAIHRLSNDAEYQGETWRIDGADSGLGADAVVLIQVETGSEPEDPQLLTVEATYPADSKRRVAHWRELKIRLSIHETSK